VERVLADRLGARGTSPEERRDVALVLAQLGTQDSELAGAVARALTEALSTAPKDTAPEESLRQDLAGALAQVAARMPPKEAADALTTAMSKTTTWYELGPLAGGLGQVAARMPPKEAADALTTAMSKTTNPYALGPLAGGLSAVLSREDPSSRLATVAGALGALTAPVSALVAPAQFRAPAEPPPPLPAQALVDLLKHPLCVGAARRPVLAQLARHYGRSFADQWDFVRFAEGRELGLDFTTSPRRPEVPVPPRP
jgi:hypothetical protein